MTAQSIAMRRAVRILASGAALVLWGCGSSVAGWKHQELDARYRAEDARLRKARATSADGLSAPGSLDRTVFVTAVLDRNPSLESAREGWRAAMAAIRIEGALEDPSLAYAFAPLSIGKEMMRYGQEVEVRQRFPFPGKRSLARESAAAEAEMALADYETMRRELASLASKLYDDYYVVHRSIVLNEEHIRLIGEFQAVAAARYASGSAMQEEPLKAEVEAAHLHHRRIELQRALRVAEARMNALLHRPPKAPLTPPPSTLPLPGDALQGTFSDTASVLAARPEVAAAEARVRSLEAQVRLAGRKTYPDFGFMTSYSTMWADPEHRWMFGVMIDVPLNLDRRSGERERARARLAQARSEEAGARDAVLLELEEAGSRVLEVAHTLDLYRSRILPASRDQLAATRAGYTAGATPFLNLIEAARNLRAVELEYEETLADYHRGLAELDRAAGRIAAVEGSVQ